MKKSKKIGRLSLGVIVAILSCYSCSQSSDTQKNITTQMTFTDSRDGNTYKFVKIGKQTWMTENLRFLPSVNPRSSSDTNPYYYVYGYNNTILNDAKATSNYKKYGVLYNWSAAMNGYSSSDLNPSGKKCLCPDGWHLPSNSEWEELEIYLKNNGFSFVGISATGNKIAKSLASKTDWNTLAPIGSVGNDQDTNNSSGFNALPGGQYRRYNGFENLTLQAYWWSSSEFDAVSGKIALIDYYSPNFYYGGGGSNYKSNGYSIRCVKD